MERAGIVTVANAEIDPACRGILARHFPATGQLDDVRKVTAELRSCNIDIVTAGWPCQGNSVAGLRKGMADPRSGLWREVARILAETRPRWFVGENVPGLLSVRRGADFAIVIKSLADLGYGVAWRVLDAQYAGVPQRRRRVIIVGCLGDPASAAQVLFDTDSVYGDSAPSRKAGAEVAGTLGSRAGGSRTTDLDGHGAYVVSTLQGGGKRGYRVDAEAAAGGHLIPVCVTGDVSGALTARCGKGVDSDANGIVCVTGSVTHTLTSEGHDASEDGSGRGAPIVAVPVAHTLTSGISATGAHAGRRQEDDYNLVSSSAGVRRLMPVECERLQGFPDGWTEWHGGTGKKQSDSARYRQLGNAVAVPVAQWVMSRVAVADRADEMEAA